MDIWFTSSFKVWAWWAGWLSCLLSITSIFQFLPVIISPWDCICFTDLFALLLVLQCMFCAFVEPFGSRFIIIVGSAAVLATRSSGLVHISQDTKLVLWIAMSVCCCIALHCIVFVVRHCAEQHSLLFCSHNIYSILIMSETICLFTADRFSVTLFVPLFIEHLLRVYSSCLSTSSCWVCDSIPFVKSSFCELLS